MFVSTAFAQGAAPSAGGPDAMLQLLPIVLIFVVFYFLLIRPQQKKMKQHKEMLGALRRGDRIATGGGIIGTITKIVDDHEVQVEIADGVRVRVQRPTIAGVLAKTEPAPQQKEPPKPGNDSGAAGNGGEAKPAGARSSRFTRILGGKTD
jgi:preprotein translocase subunit YajC